MTGSLFSLPHLLINLWAAGTLLLVHAQHGICSAASTMWRLEAAESGFCTSIGALLEAVRDLRGGGPEDERWAIGFGAIATCVLFLSLVTGRSAECRLVLWLLSVLSVVLT